MKEEIREDYDKENDILSFKWGEVEHSRELRNMDFIVDFDINERMVGIEIFDFGKGLKESQKELNKIFKKK